MKEVADSGLQIANSGAPAASRPLVSVPTVAVPSRAFSHSSAVASGNLQSATRNSQAAAPQPQSIELHIGELVLHEFAPADRYSMADAVEFELTRLFTDLGLPASLQEPVEVDRINEAFRAARTASQESMGVEVARAIYRGLRL